MIIANVVIKVLIYPLIGISIILAAGIVSLLLYFIAFYTWYKKEVEILMDFPSDRIEGTKDYQIEKALKLSYLTLNPNPLKIVYIIVLYEDAWRLNNYATSQAHRWISTIGVSGLCELIDLMKSNFMDILVISEISYKNLELFDENYESEGRKIAHHCEIHHCYNHQMLQYALNNYKEDKENFKFKSYKKGLYNTVENLKNAI